MARVLLAEYLLSASERLVKMLEEAKHDVSLVTSFEETLKMLEKKEFDIVVSRLHQHDMRDAGIRLVEWMRNRKIMTPILLHVGEGTKLRMVGGAYKRIWLHKRSYTNRSLLQKIHYILKRYPPRQ